MNDEDDLICAFLKEMEKNKGSPRSFSEEQLLVLLLDLFLAGSETTSSMLSFVILLLLKHQDVQAKVHAELDAVIGDREIQLEDKNKYIRLTTFTVHDYFNKLFHKTIN